LKKGLILHLFGEGEIKNRKQPLSDGRRRKSFEKSKKVSKLDFLFTRLPIGFVSEGTQKKRISPEISLKR